MKKLRSKLFLGGLGLLLFLLVAGLVYLKLATYPAESQAKSSLTAPNVQRQGNFIRFKGDEKQATLLFYPGALVDPVSYAPLAQDLAKEGYTVYLLCPPLNLPILAKQAALELIQSEKLDPQQVYLAGHSLGGVVAADNTLELVQQKKGPKGLILLASYPASSSDLSQSQVAVLSLTASQDQIINWDSYQAAKKLLPANTDYQTIEGGNHSGFGLYGQQAKDGQASLPNRKQEQEILKRILSFIQQDQ